MVIQRWQTVFLFLATVLMVVFSLMPFASVTIDTEVVQLHPKDYPVYLVVNLLIASLLFISIFKYRNLKMQKKVTLLSVVLICCSAVTGGMLLYGPGAPKGAVELEWAGGIVLLLAALLFAIFAYRGISSDQRKLSSNDRIR
ncbi:MAG: DUF4293 domain-containing protein [Bacteroidales bacterium]|nr:DUF4293 domain-containing protein [Bacteroidales bacterium]